MWQAPQHQLHTFSAKNEKRVWIFLKDPLPLTPETTVRPKHAAVPPAKELAGIM